MGSFMGVGSRTFFVEDDGTIWDSEKKHIKFNKETLQPESSRQVEAQVVEATYTVTPAPTETVTSLHCNVCGFEAKSNAGLAVHKMKHNEAKTHEA